MIRLPAVLLTGLVWLGPTALAQAPLDGPASLTIERAVDLAVARNERAAAAETTVEAADARLSRARSAFFPAVDVIGSYRNDSATDTRNTLASAATLSQPIFDARVFPLLRFGAGLN